MHILRLLHCILELSNIVAIGDEWVAVFYGRKLRPPRAHVTLEASRVVVQGAARTKVNSHTEAKSVTKVKSRILINLLFKRSSGHTVAIDRVTANAGAIAVEQRGVNRIASIAVPVPVLVSVSLVQGLFVVRVQRTG